MCCYNCSPAYNGIQNIYHPMPTTSRKEVKSSLYYVAYDLHDAGRLSSSLPLFHAMPSLNRGTQICNLERLPYTYCPLCLQQTSYHKGLGGMRVYFGSISSLSLLDKKLLMHRIPIN